MENKHIQPVPVPETSTHQPTKIIQNHYENKRPNLQTFDDYVQFLNRKGKQLYGEAFQIYPVDYEVVLQLLICIYRDRQKAKKFNLDVSKGILLSGPVGCGKTSLMSLVRTFLPDNHRYKIINCREVSFQFIQSGFQLIQQYSTHHFDQKYNPKTACFDDLGSESNLKFYGNECNVMGEVLLSRYDQYVGRKMITHLTTNLSATELEDHYGNRVRSRMRAMFNLIAFDKSSGDKR